jgi:hypothetical protein
MERRGAPRDLGKERVWRRLLQLWRCSGRTVRAFCAEHHLREASFYAWRRIITDRDRQHATQPAVAAACQHDAPYQATAGQATFVPVRIVPAPTGDPAAARAFEVVLNDNRVVRVPVGFDAASLRQLLAILAEEPPC